MNPFRTYTPQWVTPLGGKLVRHRYGTTSDAELTFSTNFNSCDFAVPGSPSSKTLMSPRNRIPSGRIFLLPPNKRQVIAFLMSAGETVSQLIAVKGREVRTEVTEDTGRHTSCKPFVQLVTPAQLEKLFFLLWRE